MKLGTSILSMLKTLYGGNYVTCGVIIDTIAQSTEIESLVRKLQSSTDVVLVKERIVEHPQFVCLIKARLRKLETSGFIQRDDNSVKPKSENNVAYKITLRGLKKLDDELSEL